MYGEGMYMFKAFRAFAMCCLLSLILYGCQSVNSQSEDKVTVGTVQRHIYAGMSSADVVAVLGSPNMVSKDTNGNETWVYDKVHSESEVKSSSGYLGLILLGGGQSKGSRSSSEHTLTIIIHFDEHFKVRDFSYRATTF
jgi:outer membrane protein assembly factor BamE (lipoprotein component of BamABCDE complex)